MSLEDGTSMKEKFKPTNPPLGEKTGRPTDNGHMGSKKSK